MMLTHDVSDAQTGADAASEVRDAQIGADDARAIRDAQVGADVTHENDAARE